MAHETRRIQREVKERQLVCSSQFMNQIWDYFPLLGLSVVDLLCQNVVTPNLQHLICDSTLHPPWEETSDKKVAGWHQLANKLLASFLSDVAS